MRAKPKLPPRTVRAKIRDLERKLEAIARQRKKVQARCKHDWHPVTEGSHFCSDCGVER